MEIVFDDNLNIKAFKRYFKNKKIFKTDDIVEFYKSINPNTPRTTINWRVYYLIQKQIIRRINRGTFKLGKTVVYLPNLDARIQEYNNLIVTHFPYIDYCIWDTKIVNEFAHHLTRLDYVILETEKSVIDSVVNLLRKDIKQITKYSNENSFFNMIENFDSPVIIKPLITESPIQKIGNVKTITIEKLLVDIISDKIFSSLSGNETIKIYKNAFERYSIVISKLIRYASRRGKKEKVYEILKTIKRQ